MSRWRRFHCSLEATAFSVMCLFHGSGNEMQSRFEPLCVKSMVYKAQFVSYIEQSISASLHHPEDSLAKSGLLIENNQHPFGRIS